MDAYIQAQLDVCNHQNIKSAWRGARLFPLNPQRALRTMVQEEPHELERPKTPTQFDIFNQVFINSSPPNETTLRAANELLNLTIQACTDITTLVCQYIKKLTAGTKRLQA